MKKLLFALLIPVLSAGLPLREGNVPEEKKCTDCHADMMAGKTIHQPASDGCDACHNSNGNEHPLNGVKGFTLASEMPGLCFTCHDGYSEPIAKSAFVHQPLKENKTCLSCHSPHSSNYEKLLLADQKTLCLNCHGKAIRAGSKTIANIKQVLEKNKFEHSAVEANGCSGCHNPHFSDQAALLKGNFSGVFYTSDAKESFALCFTCHNPELVTEASSATATSFRNGEKNLHFVHSAGQKGRGCTVCHGVHAAPGQHLLVEKIPFGDWTMKMTWSELDNGGSCLTGCHGAKTYQR